MASEQRPANGSLRGVMPQTAEIVDQLRAQLGRQHADAIIARGKAGWGVAYFAERGPDGVLRTFGHVDQGRRVELRHGALVWLNAKGEAQAWPPR